MKNRLDREILRLAIPSILANITVPIVGMVDVAVAGHIGDNGLATAAAFIGSISGKYLLTSSFSRSTRPKPLRPGVSIMKPPSPPRMGYIS